jgi:hypothetical protein
MKKLVLSLSILLLTACANTKMVSMPFPDAPAELKQTCPALEQVDPNTKKLSDLVGTVSDNYALYFECQVKVENWIEWYNTQQQIYNKVSK